MMPPEQEILKFMKNIIKIMLWISSIIFYTDSHFEYILSKPIMDMSFRQNSIGIVRILASGMFLSKRPALI
jgi:hypothetical protein